MSLSFDDEVAKKVLFLVNDGTETFYSATPVDWVSSDNGKIDLEKLEQHGRRMLNNLVEAVRQGREAE